MILPPVLAGCSVCFFMPKARAKFNARSTMVWAKGVLAVLGIDVDSTGHRTVVTGFTVCNHVSYLDILVMASVSPSVFVSKMEVRSWPVIGLLARLAGTVFVDRTSRAASRDVLFDVERMLWCGVNVVVFPEGTTTDGSATGQFKGMFFEAPARAKVPVIPVSIKYHPEGDKGEAIPWHGDMTLLPHLWNLMGTWRINAFLYFNRPVTDVPSVEGAAKRKYLTARSRERVISGLSCLDKWLAVLR